MSQSLQGIPPAVLLRCRELQKQNEFKRRIMKRTPRDIEIDIAELACGHERAMFGWNDVETIECNTCIDEWLKSNSAKGDGK